MAESCESGPLERLAGRGVLESVNGADTVVSVFYATAQRFAERIAVRDGTRSLSYAELAARVERIAAAIRSLAIDSGPVAVLLGNEVRYPVALLGVLAAGRPCVPLDASHPLERNGRIIAHAGVTAVVTCGELAAQVCEVRAGTVPVVDLNAETTWATSGQHGRAAAHDVAEARQRSLPAPEDTAAIIYTSGSTGTPKGVFQNHRGVLRDVQQSASIGSVGESDRIALFYTPAVIVGWRTLLTGILSGATLEILPPLALGPAGLARESKARGLTRINLSPTLFRHIVGALEEGERFESLQTVVLGGERIDWSDVALFQRACPPRAGLYVHLGATECWTIHTQWRVDPARRGTSTSPHLPVGRTVAGRSTVIVGDEGRVLADGEVGEIVVFGRDLALGYWREPELTAKAFGSNTQDPLLRSYRTGDLGRRHPDGLLEFIGRKDQQIKLHGYRIEPGEVESALKGCAGVRDAAILVRHDERGAPMALAGYVQLREGEHTLLPRHLLAMLGRRVPPYMMPAEIVLVDELPWLPNFKLDRRRLAELDAARAAARPDTVQSPVIAQLIEIFQRVTKVSGATADDNVLSLGGDSLQTLEVTLEIARHFDIEIVASEDDATRTIVQWAREVAARKSSGTASVACDA